MDGGLMTKLEISKTRYFDQLCLNIVYAESWGETEDFPIETIHHQKEMAKAIVIALVGLAEEHFGGNYIFYKGFDLPKILVEFITTHHEYWPQWYDKTRIPEQT